MKLYKALKLRKSLTGDIGKLKEQITRKNSYLTGSINDAESDIKGSYGLMLEKIDLLVGLKYAINEGNKEIQSMLYTLAEYKGLISFWKGVSIEEGAKAAGYASDKVLTYEVHFNEKSRDEIIESAQKRVDSIQDEIDVYNYTTEILWEQPVNDDQIELLGK